MSNNNPYQAPKVTTEIEVGFDADRLPLVFNIPMGWIGYWGGMLALAFPPSCIVVSGF